MASWYRFNSATALTPWKTAEAKEEREAAKGLQFGHGADAVEDESREIVMQRWRERFNSATALTPWKTIASRSRKRANLKLQFGHGADAVEDGSTAGGRWRMRTALQFGHGADA